MMNSLSNLLTAPWTVSVVFTAIRLKIFSHLSNQMMTIEELSSKCLARPHLLKPLLDACISMGLVNTQNNKYFNSHFSQIYLVEGMPKYVGDLIELQYQESRQWDKLYDIILGQEKSLANENVESADHRTFIKAMNNLGMIGEAEALTNAVDLSGYKNMVDAGGGSGLYSIALCKKYPQLKSTIIDVRDSLVVAKEYLAEWREKERITLRETDITRDFFGKDIDVVLLSDVIYDESIAAKVLTNAWSCLNQNGLLIIRGYYADPESSRPLFGALFVLGQLVFDPQRKILTISTLQEFVNKIGFKDINVKPLTERSLLLIARK